MSAREIAGLWLVGIIGIAIIIWDHFTQTNLILNALGAGGQAGVPGTQANPIVTRISSNVTTNDAMPVTGNEFGALGTYGTVMSGDVQPLDAVFGDMWNNLSQH